MSAEKVRRMLESAESILHPLSVDEALEGSSPPEPSGAPIGEALTFIRAALASLVPAVPSEGLTAAERAWVDFALSVKPQVDAWREAGDNPDLLAIAEGLVNLATIIDRLSASVPAVGPGEVDELVVDLPDIGGRLRVVSWLPQGLNPDPPGRWLLVAVPADEDRDALGYPRCVTPPEDSPDAPEEAR